jgi:hypothetical protein
MMVIQKEVPSLNQFIYPPREIRKSIEDLLKYYQLQNQKSVFLYEKWKDRENFSGTMNDYDKVQQMKELYKVANGKAWEPLLQIIILIDEYTEQFNFENFAKLNESQKRDVIQIISNGQIAHQKIKKWIEPINHHNVLASVYSAMKIKIGNETFDQFQVLKFADIKTIPNKNNSLGIFPELLEIDDPPALVQYFKLQKEAIHECIILAFMRGKSAHKPTIYLFMIWNNGFYVISMSDKRMNLENTAGERNPDKYKERIFGDVWLPLEIFFGQKKISETSEIVVRSQKIFKRGKMSKIFQDEPESKAWLDMFSYKIIDYLTYQRNEIQKGFIPKDIIKMLPDKSKQKIETRVKILERHSSFESMNDASSYLVKKYGESITSVVPAESDYPVIIGTKNFIEGVVKFKQRIKIADTVERRNYKDFRKNSKKVYNEFRIFVRKHDLVKILELALLDKEYGYMEYPYFSTRYIGKYPHGKDVHIKKPTIFREKILRIDDPDDWETRSWTWESNPLEILWTKHNKPIYNQPCATCNKFKHKKIISIKFKDFRQICEFFNIKKEELPIEFVEHFHRQKESYVGNSILDDVDPMDEIMDFWFRKVIKHQLGYYKNTKNYLVDGDPYFNIRIPICKRCFKKHGKVVKK